MNPAFQWLSGPPIRGLFAEESGHPKSKQRRAGTAPTDKPWTSADGFDFVIRRRDLDGSAFYFVADPPCWSPSWRAATRFHDRHEAERLIASKTAISPAGPAAEIGASVVRLGSGFAQ